MALLQPRAISPVFPTSSAAIPRAHPSPCNSASAATRGSISFFSIRSLEVGNPLVQEERENSGGPAAVRIAAEGYGFSENDDDEVVPRENMMISLVAPQKMEKFQSLSQEAAMGIVLQAAVGKGWTTGSGLEGPASPQGADLRNSEHYEGNEWPNLTRSPRRSMRVAFTCNVCGHRTTRAINPHAYTDGTVFVQCGGCDVFHKLVDNLNLFHELKGRVFPGYVNPGFAYHEPYDYLKFDEYLG